MRAIIVDRWMKPEELMVSEAAEPVPAMGEVLVEVRAAGCNFFDTLLVQGRYQVKPPFPFFPGGEVAGVVRAVGSSVRVLRPGDRVMAHVGHGGFAELACAPARSTFKIPEGMSFEHAAAFPVVYGTAYAGVALRGGARSGDVVLVTAAAGGVGLAAIQVAKALGARVLAAASGDKLTVATAAGADVTMDYRSADFGDRVREATFGRGADVVLENVGGDVFEACMRCTAWGGRLVVCGFSSGKIPEVRLNRVLLKHIALVGLHFGPMLEHEPETLRAAFDTLFGWYGEGKLRPHIHRTFPLEEAPLALQALQSRETVGKVVLTV